MGWEFHLDKKFANKVYDLLVSEGYANEDYRTSFISPIILVCTGLLEHRMVSLC